MESVLVELKLFVSKLPEMFAPHPAPAPMAVAAVSVVVQGVAVPPL